MFFLSAFSNLATENELLLNTTLFPPFTFVCEPSNITRPFLTMSSVVSPGTTLTR
jgi:hypothetical protein